MKKTVKKNIQLLYFLIGILVLNSCKKEDLSSIKNTDSFNITSNYTSTTYSINVLYPETYNASLSYQTIYMLDGDDYFKEASEVIANTKREDIILIGIGYANKNKRGTDYSYPKDNDFPNDSGGAKKFIKFLNKELMPYIENELKIESKNKTLFGHSLGGYFALYILFQQEQINSFDNIIAVSANFLWGNAYLFDLEKKRFSSNSTLNKNLYLTVGDLEGVSINLFFNAFTNKIKEHSYSGLKLNQERLKNTSHRNSPIITLKKALSIIL